MAEVGEGAGLVLYGAGFTFLLNRYRVNDHWREKVARSRWKWDRLTIRRARRLGQEAWIAAFSRSQRRLVTWVGIPFACLWTCLAATILIRGLIG